MQNREVRLAAILYAQVLGFDRLFERDAEEGLVLLDRLNALFGRVCEEHRGRVVRSVRDTYLVEFPTSLDAVNCSVAIQRETAAIHPATKPTEYGLTIGIHVGDVHFLENDAAGEPIVVATKLQTTARPGTIAISEEVFGNVSERIGVSVRYRTELQLEGGKKKIRIYEVDPASTEVSSGARGADTNSPTNSPEDFDELKVFVLEQIKRFGRRLTTDRVRRMLQSQSPELDEAIEKLADMGFLSRSSEPARTLNEAPTSRPLHGPHDRDAWREARHAIREAVRDARHEYRHAPRPPLPFDSEDAELEERGYDHYRERVIERAHKAVGGFAGHLIPFLVVNGFLFFINLSTATGLGFPWFLFPLGGWGIGLVSHLATVRTRRRERAEVEALPETLDDTDYKMVRRYHKARASVSATLASTISVAAFLLMINLIVSPGFLWAAFPIAGLFIAIVTSISSYASRRGSFRKRLKELFASKGRKAATGSDSLAATVAGEDPPVVKQALRIADSILEQSKKLDPTRAYLGEDLEPLLTNYIGQIRTLNQRGREVEEIMAAIPRVELQKDLSALRARYDKAEDISLRREYQKSIDQIERQNKSFDELENQKELLDLRITGSLNSLKQMQIDLARMTGISAAKEIDSIGRLRDRSRELSDYLQDFSEGYDEIGGLPQTSEEERRRADELLNEFKNKEEKSRNQDD